MEGGFPSALPGPCRDYCLMALMKCMMSTAVNEDTHEPLLLEGAMVVEVDPNLLLSPIHSKTVDNTHTTDYRLAGLAATVREHWGFV